ncbi:MAG: hypothetical protein ACTSRN_01460 [Alphaproteobacteria bacterium]
MAIAITAFGFCAVTPVQAEGPADFTATAVQSVQGQPEQTGLIAKSGQNMRFEYEQSGSPLIKILRPTEGLVLILDPETQTYIEFIGPAVPQEAIEGHTTPCPTPTQETQGLRCERSGNDVTISGVQTERWLLGYPQQQPQVIMWDPARRHALAQEYADGSIMQMSFQAMEQIDGNPVEHWVINLQTSNQAPLTGDWWFSPELRMVVRENLPSGETRRLENIQTGPVDPALFQVPAGWQKQKISVGVNAPAPNE